MTTELYIARRILGEKGHKSTTTPIVKIAQIGIAAGVCIMLLSIFITSGFKNEIADKLSGFSSAITITPSSLAGGWSEQGDSLSSNTIATLKTSPNILNIYPFVTKPAILRGRDELHGVIIRGLDTSAPISFYEAYTKIGRFPDLHSEKASQEILISSNIANLLNLKIGDKVNAHFIQQPPRVRPLTVVGIYETGFKEFDDVSIVGDLRLLQRINNWESNIYSGYGINITNIQQAETVAMELDDISNNGISNSGWITRTIFNESPEIFDWLKLLDMNVWVILILLVCVAGFNMVSSLLIMILDKARMIGILKAIGMANISLRKLFLWIAAGLIVRGVLWGNVVALIFAVIQNKFHIFTLNAETYYMSWVPISIQISDILWLNIGVTIATVAMLIIPTMLITKISPIKVIRFE